MKTIKITSRASLLIATIMAASHPQSVSGQELPAAQLSAGYSHLASPSAVIVYGGGDASNHGWFAEIVGNMAAHAGFVGQVSATYTGSTFTGRGERVTHRAYSFLGGGRATAGCCRRVAPFGQVLAGMVRINADVSRGGQDVSDHPVDYFGMLFGGGADIRLGAGPAGLHVGADVVRISRGSDGFGPSGNTWRLLVGMTVPMR
jgi:hypothetical protein